MRGSAAFRTGAAPVGPWVRDELWRRARAVPSLDLRFADNKTLRDSASGSELVTFTRASSGTYVGSDGLIRTAVTNLFLQSNQFDTTWSNSNSSETSAAGTAPDGTNTAWELKDTVDVSSTTHAIQQTIAFTSGTTYTASVWAKTGTLPAVNSLGIVFPSAAFGTTLATRFNLAIGTVSSAAAGSTSTITAFPNGWYRCTMSLTATATASSNISFRTGTSTATSYIGDGNGTILLWGAQLEQSSTVGEYIPTTSTINSAPRFDHNPTTGESLGLLVEESRTNLTQKSQEFEDVYWAKTDCTITPNESTAPDGTLTADLWTNTATPGTIQASLTKDATSRTYTASLWVKSTMTQFTLTVDGGSTTNRGRVQFNLSTNTVNAVFNEGNFTSTSGTLIAYSNGWVRLTLTTTTSTATTLRIRPFFSNTGATARIWGAQVEEGTFATSYIPTTTATVTRSADVASISGSNFSSWYRQNEGTVFAAISNAPSMTPGSFPFLASLSDGTNNNRAQITRYNTGTVRPSIITASVTQAGFDLSPNILVGGSGQTVFALKNDDVAGVVNGGAVVTDLSATLPLVSQLNIGASPTSGLQHNGTIRRLTYWPQRLPNETLQAVTQ